MGAIRDAIVEKLQGATSVTALTPRIYPGLPAEKSPAYPFITVEAYKAPVAQRTFQAIAYEDATILVKAIDRSTSAKKVRDINAAIRAALDGQTLTIDGMTALSVTWLANVEYNEQEDGLIYQHEGSLVEVWASAT